MKRIFSILIVILLLLGLMSACAKPQNADPTDSEEKNEIFDTQNDTENGVDSDKSTDNSSGDDSGFAENDGNGGNDLPNNSDNGNGNGDNSTETDNGGNNNTETDNGGSGNTDDENETKKDYIREGNYIYFGEYPQSLKKSSVTVSSTADSRGYFRGNDNCYYAKVVASPYENGYKFSNGTALTSGATYYFKVEPIKWRILSESNGTALLLCESIIASKRYDDSKNDYETSEIRTWLNNEFLNTAFSNIEKELLQIITVDNSAASTGFTENKNASANTSDKVILLSYKDVTNVAYGFAADKFASDTRTKKTSDYARASGAWMTITDWNGHYGNGLWMLRSPINDSGKTFIRECFFDGEVSDGGTKVTNKFFGVVPAIKIKL